MTGAESRPPVTVVVCSRDRPAMLAVALARMGAALGPDDELLVVDSASRTDETGVVARAAGATVVRSERGGLSVARNLGWRSARHAIVAYTDDDVTIDPGWVDALGGVFVAHPEASFASGAVLIPAGQEGVSLPVAVFDGEQPRRFDATSGDPPGMGASFAFRVEALARIGGFDEELGAGRPLSAEDLDAFDRLIATGAIGWFEPSARSWHDQWRTRWERLTLEWEYAQGNGARLAKLARLDRRRLRLVGRIVVVDWCFEPLGRHVRGRHEYLVAVDLVRLVGVAVGVVRGGSRRLAGGHFRPRTRGRT